MVRAVGRAIEIGSRPAEHRIGACDPIRHGHLEGAVPLAVRPMRAAAEAFKGNFFDRNVDHEGSSGKVSDRSSVESVTRHVADNLQRCHLQITFSGRLRICTGRMKEGTCENAETDQSRMGLYHVAILDGAC